MPLTLTLTEGVLPVGAEINAFQRLADSMLKWTGLTGNEFMLRAVIGSIHVLPSKHTLAGLQPASAVFIEWKVPAIAFTDRDVQIGYIREATEIIHELSGGRHPKERVWVNVTHAVDGTWGIGGEAFSNVQLVEAIERSGKEADSNRSGESIVSIASASM